MTKLQIENTAFATQVFTYPYLDKMWKCDAKFKKNRHGYQLPHGKIVMFKF